MKVLYEEIEALYFNVTDCKKTQRSPPSFLYLCITLPCLFFPSLLSLHLVSFPLHILGPLSTSLICPPLIVSSTLLVTFHLVDFFPLLYSYIFWCPCLLLPSACFLFSPCPRTPPCFLSSTLIHIFVLVFSLYVF